jgi:hypothetical protein
MLAEIVPVATDWALTAPVVTEEVMYFEPDDVPKVGPTTTSATAPTPTRISAIAANLTFMVHASRVFAWLSDHGEAGFGALAPCMAQMAEAHLN